MAATPATGTRGQFPGVGAGGQPRRRNPVNVPRTFRGTRLASSNQALEGFAGLGTTDTHATATLTVIYPPALLPRTLIPGVAHGVKRRRNPVNVPRTWRGTKVSPPGVALAGLATTDTSATLAVPPPSLGSVGRFNPGIAPGMRRRRNPVNAPRTFRGTRVYVKPPPFVGIALAGLGTTDTNAIGVFFILNLSLQGLGTTDTMATGTLALTGLVGEGLTGSIGTGTANMSEAVAGEGLTGSVALGTLSVGVQEQIHGVGITGTQATATPSSANALIALGTTGTVATMQVFGVEALAALGDTHTSAHATLSISTPLRGVAVLASLAVGTLNVSQGIPLNGVGATASQAFVTLVDIPTTYQDVTILLSDTDALILIALKDA